MLPQSANVNLDTARDLAWQNLQRFLVVGEAGPDRADWSVDNLPEGAGNLFQTGTKIFDIRGRPFFYEFSLTLQNGKEMRARPVADRQLGTPVLNTSVGKPLPIAMWLEQAAQLAAASGLEPLAGPERLVCYSYPKLGLLCDDRTGRRVVIDLADHSIIPVREGTELELSDLVTTWSPLDVRGAAPEAGAGVERFRVKSALLADFARSVPEDAEQSENVLAAMKLAGQQTPVFCAVASAQMILGFNGFEKTQNDIAIAMQTGPSGSTPDNQLPAYGILTNNALKGNLDQLPTFEQGKTEINNKRPFKSGIMGLPKRSEAGRRFRREMGRHCNTCTCTILDRKNPRGSGTVYR